MKLSKVLSAVCSCVLLFIGMTSAAPRVGSGGGELGSGCLQPKTKLHDCRDNETVTQFYFDQRQNRCRGYHTCPITTPEAVPNLFQTRAECTEACPATSCPVTTRPPTNGDHLVVEHSNGVVNLQYTCSEGYTLLGDAERTCQHDGTWSGQPPSCEIRCPTTEEEIENGQRIALISSTPAAPKPYNFAIYSCDKGFQNILTTGMIRMCQLDGTWNNPLPVCGKLEIRHNNTEVKYNLTAKDGEVLQVDCVMTPNFPPNANVEWQYPTSNASSTTHWAKDRSAFSLEIPDLKPTHSGNYDCIVHVGNKVIKKKIEVKVNKVANVRVITNPQHYEDGNAVGLHCAFHGTVKPTVTWLYNNEVLDIEGDPRITLIDESLHSQQYTLSHLRIANRKPSDSGVYVCRGSAAGGVVVDSSPLNLRIVASNQNRRRRRSLSSTASLKLELSSLCPSSDPSTATYLGKMVRLLSSSNAYYLHLDKEIYSNSGVSKHYVRARSSQQTDLSLKRQTRYFFSIRTTDRGENIIAAAYPYSLELERLLSTVCPQLNH